MTKRIMQVLILVMAAGGLCAFADPVLTLTPPSGTVLAGPGQTTGWGFTITNDTSFYLLIDSSNFCGVGGDPAFADCNDPSNPPFAYGPALGTYTDFIASQATLVFPDSFVTEAFNKNTDQGVGSYAISLSTPLYSTDSGKLFVSFMEFQGNPFDLDNPGTQISGDIELSSAAKVEAIPEPAAWALAGLPLLALLWRARRKRSGN
jgi:hypothetical protein